MSAPTPSRAAFAVEAAGYERAAARLLAEIESACDPALEFPALLEAALRSAVDLLAAEPELSRLLVFEIYGDPELEARAVELAASCAALLRTAALRAPVAFVPPPFVEPHLIAGICWLLRGHLDGREDLTDIVPLLLEFVLAHYYPPDMQPGDLTALQPS